MNIIVAAVALVSLICTAVLAAHRARIEAQAWAEREPLTDAAPASYGDPVT